MVNRVIINGKLYDQSAKQTARELGVNYSTLNSRLLSKTEKWKDWKLADVSYSIKIDDKDYDDIDAAIFALLDIKKRIHKLGIQNSKPITDNTPD